MSDFINAMLAEEDVAYVDEDKHRVMCRVCKVYVCLDTRPYPAAIPHSSGDERRRWKLDWNMHRQKHFNYQGHQATRAPAPATSRQIHQRPVPIQSNAQISPPAAQHASPPPPPRRSEQDLEQLRHRELLSDSSVLAVEPHKILCARCQEWIALDPYVRFSVLRWERHSRDCTRNEQQQHSTQRTPRRRKSNQQAHYHHHQSSTSPVAQLPAIPPISPHLPAAPGARANPMSISSLLSESSTAPIPPEVERSPSIQHHHQYRKRSPSSTSTIAPPPHSPVHYHPYKSVSPYSEASPPSRYREHHVQRSGSSHHHHTISSAASSSSGDSPILPVTPPAPKNQPPPSLKQKGRERDLMEGIEVIVLDDEPPRIQQQAPVKPFTLRPASFTQNYSTPRASSSSIWHPTPCKQWTSPNLESLPSYRGRVC